MQYFGSKLSDHIVETPEGYLICLDTAINRTGSQIYLGSELQIDDRNGNERIEIVRDEDDVFDKATLASFEGKPFCNEHPKEDVDSSNITFYNTGHAQNIRREGDKTIADIYVTDPKTIQDIKNGKRKISCGYSCEFEPLGDGRYKQVNIRGNHIALVDSGRAGEQVRIIDSQAKDNTTFNNEEDFFKQLINKVSNFSGDGIEYADILDEIHSYSNNGKLDNRKAQQLISKLKTRYEYLCKNKENGVNSVAEKIIPLKDSSNAYLIYKRDIDNASSKSELYEVRTEIENRRKYFSDQEYNDLMKQYRIKEKYMKDSSINDDNSTYRNYLTKMSKLSNTPQNHLEMGRVLGEVTKAYKEGKLTREEFDSLWNQKGTLIKDYDNMMLEMGKAFIDRASNKEKAANDYINANKSQLLKREIGELKAYAELKAKLLNYSKGVNDMSFKQQIKDSLTPIKERFKDSLVPIKQKIKNSIKDTKQVYDMYDRFIDKQNSLGDLRDNVEIEIENAKRVGILENDEYNKLVNKIEKKKKELKY